MVPFSRTELCALGVFAFVGGFLVAYLWLAPSPAPGHSASWEGGYDWIVVRRAVPGVSDVLTACRTYVDDRMYLLDGFGSGDDFLRGCLAAVEGHPR